jgi:hypothetical protein
MDTETTSDTDNYQARGKKAAISRNRNKRVVTQILRRDKFRMIQETFKNIKIREPKIRRKGKNIKIETQIRESIEIAEQHKDVLKNTILKALSQHNYFKEEISKTNFIFWDAYFFIIELVNLCFIPKKTHGRNFIIIYFLSYSMIPTKNQMP